MNQFRPSQVNSYMKSYLKTEVYIDRSIYVNIYFISEITSDITRYTGMLCSAFMPRNPEELSLKEMTISEHICCLSLTFSIENKQMESYLTNTGQRRLQMFEVCVRCSTQMSKGCLSRTINCMLHVSF